MNSTNLKREPTPSELAVQSTYKIPSTFPSSKPITIDEANPKTNRMSAPGVTVPLKIINHSNNNQMNPAPPPPPPRVPSGLNNGFPFETPKPTSDSSVRTNDAPTHPNTWTHSTHSDLEPNAMHTSPANAYDSMLGEIQDLLMAAQEAQSLGRLRMASTYQMLAHTRLIGLGKRFDRFCFTSLYQSPNTNTNTNHIMTMMESEVNPPTTLRTVTQGGDASEVRLSFEGQPSSSSTTPSLSMPSIIQTSTADHSSPLDLTPYADLVNADKNMTNAQVALSKVLPSHVNVDDTMMEHLARAAMELHNIRTGRRGVGSGSGSGGSSWNPTMPISPSKMASSSMKATTTPTTDNIMEHEEDGLDMQDIEEDDDDEDNHEDEDHRKDANGSQDQEINPNRRGRGKSQPAQAISTVSNVSFDARQLLRTNAFS